MGGCGTWDAIRRYPNRFAAATPLSGVGNLNQGALLKNIPIWAYHGAMDDVIPVSATDQMSEAIKGAGGSMEYTRAADIAHTGWVMMFDKTAKNSQGKDLYEWMFSQALSTPKTPTAETPEVKFSKRCLIYDMNEGCAVADVNKDGKPDIIAGELWYAAPDFIPRPLRHIDYAWGDTLYSTGDYPYDVDGDGWVDVISNGWKDGEIAWYQNPGADGVFAPGRRMEFNYPQHVLAAAAPGYETETVATHRWPRHVLANIGPGMFENLVLHDFDGDGRPELYTNGAHKRIYRFIKDAQGQPALEAAVSNFGDGDVSGSGYAIGDVNGDGLDDILTPVGFYEQPKDKADIFTKQWRFHPETNLHCTRDLPACPFVVAKLTDSGCNDIIWAEGHNYGLYWLEQGEPKPDGTTTWTQHEIDKSWSQAHVLVWADIDGDGQPELITGKRARTHVAPAPNGDNGCKESGCIYYYHWDKAAKTFTRHTIAGPEEDIGIGMQIAVADLNGDGRPDIVVSGKTGTWILWNEGQKK
jgi:hypothetical protein